MSDTGWRVLVVALQCIVALLQLGVAVQVYRWQQSLHELRDTLDHWHDALQARTDQILRASLDGDEPPRERMH